MIFVTIYQRSYPLMKGNFTFTAIPGTMSGTVSPTSQFINAITTYVFSITLNHPITTTGYITIGFPTNVTFNYHSCSLSGTGTNPSAVCSSLNSTTFKIANIFTSLPSFPTTISVTVGNLTNPSSQQTTSSFGIFSYYSSSN